MQTKGGKIIGSAGYATRLEVAPKIPSDFAQLQSWIMHLPRQHPFWDDYMVSLCSLSDFPGVAPANKQYPEAEYELMILAMDPDMHPNPKDRETWVSMTPPNYVKQFHGVNREEAIEIVRQIVYRFVNGMLFAEPQGVYGARDAFDQAFAKLMEVIPARIK